MNNFKLTNVGESIKFFTSNDILDILKTMSKNTNIYDIPDNIIELINGDIRIAKEVVRYVPNVYFKFGKKLKNDRQIMKETIISYRNHQ